MRPPTLRVIPPAARLTLWAKHHVVGGLRGNDLLLNLRQQQLRFGQCQTQMGNLTKPIRSADLHHVEALRLTVTLGPYQT
jgi:hypothetical protein